MSTHRAPEWDAIVVGGGPAGAAAAIRLAAAGRRVVVLEREAFPRFHVGESLLPETTPVFERLGLEAALERVGFVVKRGAVFVFETGEPSGRVSFSRALQPTAASTYQVERSRFDKILLDAARERGATVIQPARATEIGLDEEGIRVTVSGGAEGGPRNAATGEQRLHGRYLIDASGRFGFLAKRLGLRRPDPSLENVALFAHYSGWSWPAEVPAGDIQVVSRRDLGWAWIIPLAGGRTSAGVVVSREQWRRRRAQDRGELLDELLRSMPVVAAQMTGAARISGAASMSGAQSQSRAERGGEARVEADFSYSATRYTGDRWLLAGDAGSFLDPVFSTGILLALQSGEEAGAAVDAALGDPESARRTFDAYEDEQRHRYEFFGRYVRAFYDPAVRDLLCRPAARLKMIEALTSVLAGHSRTSWPVRWRTELFFALGRMQRRLTVAPRLHDHRLAHGVPRDDAGGRQSSREAPSEMKG